MKLFKAGFSTKILLVCFSVLMVSCGKITPQGNIEVAEIKTTDFTNLDLKGNFRVFYINADSSFVNVETYKNIADNLRIKVEDNTLKISEKRKTENVDFYNITIYSKLKATRITLTDRAEFNSSSQIQTDKFQLTLDKNAKFIGSVKSRIAELTMKGKTRANFEGFSKSAVLTISDSASIIAPYWEIGTVKINSKNGNYAEINAKDSLKGEVKNTAELVYYGDPVRSLKIDKTATVENRILN